MKKIYAMSVVCLIMTIATAQQKSLDFDAIDSGTFSARGVYGLRPMNCGLHYTTLQKGKILQTKYSDGEVSDTIFDASQHTPKIAFNDYQFSDDETMIIIPTNRKGIYRRSSTADYMIYDRSRDTLYMLSDKGPQQEATISPDGRKVAFVRDNNLYIVDLITSLEKQITTDGVRGEIINGIPDWVYEEEYGFSRAFEWSPSSDAIAFYRFDEHNVSEYSMNTFNGNLYPVNFNFKYPKAGEKNSIVQIRVYDTTSGVTKTMDVGVEQDQYIPHIEWTGRKNELAIHRLNRLQNKYEMLFADTNTGSSNVIYSETNPRYVERIDASKVTFLPDGKRFIVQNENDGWNHLYLYDMTGKQIHQITKGSWEVTAINGIDFRNGKIYYTSTEISPHGRDLYIVGFGTAASNMSRKKILTKGDGTYHTSMSNGCKYYISSFSNSTTPTVVTLHRADGKVVRVLEDNAALKSKLHEWEMPVKEFVEIPVNGTILNGYILKPKDFDPSKRYPLFMTQYSGPGSQTVANSWGIGWEAALLKEGYLVVSVDGRGTGFRGEEFRKCTYGRLGELETLDQIAAAQWFAQQPYVEAKRIGIYGWSYGGFMALNCILKGADTFAAAVAVAPVTSWRFYDTIYTEMYNGLPQDNPTGYDDNSPIFHADKLKGKLLLAHGTADDNVHIQNSYEMIERFVKAGKNFESMIYPDKDHGMGSSRRHLMNRVIEFIKTNL